MIYDLSLLDSFNLMDPFETQNEWINLLTQSFLHFRQSIFYIYTSCYLYALESYIIPIEDKLNKFCLRLFVWKIEQ